MQPIKDRDYVQIAIKKYIADRKTGGTSIPEEESECLRKCPNCYPESYHYWLIQRYGKTE